MLPQELLSWKKPLEADSSCPAFTDTFWVSFCHCSRVKWLDRYFDVIQKYFWWCGELWEQKRQCFKAKELRSQSPWESSTVSVPVLGCGAFHQSSEELWEQIFPLLLREDGYKAFFYYLCFHLPSKHMEYEDYLRKQFFIKFPMHSLSTKHFLWGLDFFVLLTRAVTVIYCFVLGGYCDHNSTNPVNPGTILMCISLGKCRDVCSILKAFPFLFCLLFFVLEWQWSQSVTQ